jgi:hypothetical protein
VSKEDWQKSYIQRVLDYHSKRYGRNIAIVGRCEEIHPELKGQLCWDWSATDKNKSGEVAIEVKRLTSRQLQEGFSVLYQTCRKLRGELRGSLKGTFLLYIRVSQENPFDFRELTTDKRQQFKNILKGLILEKAQSLPTGREQDLTLELREELPQVLPQGCYCKLYKLNDEGSYLSPHVPVDWSPPSEKLQGEDLVEFQKLLQSANHQLAEAKARGISDTFLIIVEIWFSGAEADVLQSTLRNFRASEFPHIGFLYLVGADSPPNLHELFFGDINPHNR